MVDPYSLTGMITGIIGTITGVISLIWHVLTKKSRVVLEFYHFKRGSFDVLQPRVGEIISSKLLIRNKSDKSTTIETIYLLVDNHLFEDKLLKSTKLSGNSSCELKLSFNIEKEDFNRIANRGTIKLCIDIFHTFGRIKKCVAVNLRKLPYD